MSTFDRLIFSLLVVGALQPSLTSSAQRRQINGPGITVFTERNFQGRTTFSREDVDDLELLGLNDKISSIRIGPGERWEICEQARYKGRCIIVSGNEPDLETKSFNDLISSMRRVYGEPVPRGGPLSESDDIVIFDRTNYRGRSTNYKVSNPSISNTGRSVMIGTGLWELCKGKNYSAGCVTLDRSVPDLGVYNMRNRALSIRLKAKGGFVSPAVQSYLAIIVYDRTNYRGTPAHAYIQLYPYKPVRSIVIPGGTWLICQGGNFTGRCVMLSSSVPDLNEFNIRKVGSLRPIIREPF